MAEVSKIEDEVAKSRESGFLIGETYEKARLEALRSAMESAKDAIKACVLINPESAVEAERCIERGEKFSRSSGLG